VGAAQPARGPSRFADGGFPSASGRCELFGDPEPAYLPPEAPAGLPLVMVSAKTALHFLNTSYANLPRHARAEGEMVVEMDPADAAPRGIADGDRVRVRNERGELMLAARVADGVRPGVVSIPHGRWRSLSGGAANDLTSDGLADRGGGGDFYGTRVEVEPAPHPRVPPPSRGEVPKAEGGFLPPRGGRCRRRRGLARVAPADRPPPLPLPREGEGSRFAEGGFMAHLTV